MQVYDLAWSPTGENISLLGAQTTQQDSSSSLLSMENVYEIARHSHYVHLEGWHGTSSNNISLPRAVTALCNIYQISSKPGCGVFEAHTFGKNTGAAQSHSRRHSHTPSADGRHGTSKSRIFRRESNTGDLDSAVFD